MHNELLYWLASDNGLRVHIAIISLLLLGGFGFPMPEDIPLLLAGVAASQGIVRLDAAFLSCYVGVVVADQLVYFIGYFFGQKLVTAGVKSPLLPLVTPQKIEEVREGLRKRRLFYIFLGRHLFPLRTVTFMTAGALRIPYLEFLLTDAAAALISVSVVLLIGYALGGHLTPEITADLVKRSHIYIGVFVAVCCIGYLIYRLCKRAPSTFTENSQQKGS